MTIDMPQPAPFVIEEHIMDEPRPMRVIIVGTGFSGITAAYQLAKSSKNIEFVLYEKNKDIGGVWFENRYPGAACDIPSHSYQLSYAHNTQWSSFYSTSKEIHKYQLDVVRHYGLRKYMKFEHKMVAANWDEATAKWTVKIEHEGEVFEDVGDVVITCTGGLNTWKWPDIKGLHDFGGKLLHTANFDESYDWAGKRVAVIGYGSSAIQTVPEMRKTAAQCDNFVRGKTWICSVFSNALLEKLSGQKDLDGNYFFTDEQKELYKSDPEYYHTFRKMVEGDTNSMYKVVQADSPMQAMARDLFGKTMAKKLEKRPDIFESLLPTFGPGCRRLTPGPGYLEALVEDNVEFVSCDIAEIIPEGIRTKDGKVREYDVIVCATGFDGSFKPRIPIVGREGVVLSEKWETYPTQYLSIATHNFPNYFIVGGPHLGVGSGVYLGVAEKAVEYVMKAITKMQRERIRTMEVKKQCEEDFKEYGISFFPRTIFGTSCRSRYKNNVEGGPVISLWPGSCLMAIQMFSNPRWEDWEYTTLSKQKNMFAFMGNGFTYAEVFMEGTDRTPYLIPDAVDVSQSQVKEG